MLRSEISRQLCSAGIHIGKVMIKMSAATSKQLPEPSKPSIGKDNVLSVFNCQEDRCYIITGGLGG